MGCGHIINKEEKVSLKEKNNENNFWKMFLTGFLYFISVYEFHNFNIPVYYVC